MKTDEDIEMLWAMKRYGGSFVRALGDAGFSADSGNFEKLRVAFPDYFAEYVVLAKHSRAIREKSGE